MILSKLRITGLHYEPVISNSHPLSAFSNVPYSHHSRTTLRLSVSPFRLSAFYSGAPGFEYRSDFKYYWLYACFLTILLIKCCCLKQITAASFHILSNSPLKIIRPLYNLYINQWSINIVLYLSWVFKLHILKQKFSNKILRACHVSSISIRSPSNSCATEYPHAVCADASIRRPQGMGAHEDPVLLAYDAASISIRILKFRNNVVASPSRIEML
jgi:hypothetical protein